MLVSYAKTFLHKCGTRCAEASHIIMDFCCKGAKIRNSTKRRKSGISAFDIALSQIRLGIIEPYRGHFESILEISGMHVHLK